MSRLIEVVIPDIGDDGEVDVVEVLVSEGYQVDLEQSLITLESAKASREIPSSHAGVVHEILTKVGDKVRQGTPLLMIEPAEEAAADEASAAPESAAPAAETA